jgi:hypothetical protein
MKTTVLVALSGKTHYQATYVTDRVGKNPGFFKKKPAHWVFLGFFAQTRGFLGLFSVSRILLGASRL